MGGATGFGTATGGGGVGAAGAGAGGSGGASCTAGIGGLGISAVFKTVLARLSASIMLSKEESSSVPEFR